MQRFQGWPHVFRSESWPDLAARYDEQAEANPSLEPMAAIVHSIADSDAAALLAGCTSMFDLMVVPTPIPEPPFGFVAVRSPVGSLRSAPAGSILIEHVSGTGHDDQLTRPADEAVGLFWRFMIEKFGVHPTRQNRG